MCTITEIFQREWFGKVERLKQNIIIQHSLQFDADDFIQYQFINNNLFYRDKLIGKFEDKWNDTPESGIIITCTFIPIGWEVENVL